jgi:hypothetical protein
MCPKGEQEDALRSFVSDKLEYDPQVVACAARPTSFQLTLEFVGLQTGMKAVRGKQFQGRLKVLVGLRMFLESFLCFANKRAGAQ